MTNPESPDSPTSTHHPNHPKPPQNTPSTRNRSGFGQHRTRTNTTHPHHTPMQHPTTTNDDQSITTTDQKLIADGGQPPIDVRLEQITDELREKDQLGELMLAGDVGFHTFYDPKHADYGIGTTTALHLAFEETIEEVWLDPQAVYDTHGRVTPETVAAEAETQIDHFVGAHRFTATLTKNLQAILEEAADEYGPLPSPSTNTTPTNNDEAGNEDGDNADSTDHAGEDLESDGGVDVSRYYQLTGFRRDLLKVLKDMEGTDTEPYGLGIQDDIQTWYGTDVNHGRVYDNLKALIEKSLVERERLDDRTNRYTLTPTGRRLLQAALTDPLHTTHHQHTQPTDQPASAAGEEGDD
jgi:DNA-binding PadR family transcriptional regulator